MANRYPSNQSLRRRVLPVSIACAAALIGFGGMPAGAMDTPAGESYVALGDSFAAGPTLQPQVTAQPTGCRRSQVNFPHLTAEALTLQLTDLTCSGATTASVRQTQLGALTAQTAVVSITWGANDIHCFAWCVSNPAVLKSMVDSAAAGQWQPLLAAIHDKAPNASVFLVGYGSYVPLTGCAGVPPGTAYGIQTVINAVNAGLRDLASRAGVTYVDVTAASTEHTACTPEGTRWFEPSVSSSDAAPWHPTHAGMTGIAALLENAVDVLSSSARSTAVISRYQ